MNIELQPLVIFLGFLEQLGRLKLEQIQIV